jgi:hypothetical protein
MPPAGPSIAELRQRCQPAAMMTRRSAEHWAGRLYMRRVSIYVTRALLPTPLTPNQLTLVMIVVGLAGGVIAGQPGLLGALLTVAAIQVYLLFDCVDGEVARWRATTSAAGVYLDRLGHYVVEASLLIGLGARAGGGWRDPGGWLVVGTLAALLHVLSKAETDLVVVARATSGLPSGTADDAEVAAPKPAGLRAARGVFALLPVHRLTGGVELSLAILVAAVIDAVADVGATRTLAIVALAVSVLVAVGHPVGILTSRRLDP